MTSYEKHKLTFINVRSWPISDIRQMFGEFGSVTQVHEHGTRVFIRFRHDSEAKDAHNGLQKKISGLSFAIKNTRTRKSLLSARIRSKNYDLSDSETKIGTSPTPSLNSTSSLENIDISMDAKRRNGSPIKNEVISLPPLIDSTTIAVLPSVILGNLPEQYTVEDVHKLVEEIHPVGFSKLELTSRMKLRFCEVYLRDEDDVTYLIGKLDNFVISGKSLIAVEPSELLSRKIWNI